MSLLVWLPMTKDLTQQGLQTVSATNVGATLDNNGKLGKCYSFNGNGNYLLFNYGLPKTVNTWSYCCWAKLVNNSTTMCLYSQRTTTTDNQRTIFIVQGKVFYFDDGVRIQGSLNTSADLTQWNHYAFIRNGNSLKIYINGIETVSTTISSTPATVGSYTMIGASQSANTTPSGNSLYGYLNDIRLYDHALSPKEIEILSRGLVCHYPLNGGGRGGDNMCTWGYTRNPLFSGNAGTTKLTDTDYGEYRRYTCTTAGTSGGRYGYPRTTAGDLAQGTVYTWSAEFRANKQLSFTSSSYIGMEGGGLLAGSDIKIDTEWRRLSKTWTQTTSQAFVLYPKDSVAVNDWIDIRNLKIEVGDKATPYIPNPADTAYTAMGYNSTTEYDVSGNGYNGTKNGTMTYSSDTARYSVSTTFNGTDTYIEADPLPTETKTISCWLKTPWAYVSGSYQLAIHDKNTGLAIGWSGSGLITYVGSGNGGTGSLLNTSSIWQANKWMHVVIVKTGSTTRDIYINGVKQSPSGANYWGGDLNKLNIGNRHISGSYSAYFNGQISDFRAYATALSAAQVAELYNTAVSVANNGTLMGYELIEN